MTGRRSTQSGEFRGFYGLDAGEFRQLWKTALFIFDTSAILNLYRHPAGAREDLFNALDQIQDRIWVPFHVGLEYQRHRLSVIAEQKKRFSEVKSIISSVSKDLEHNLSRLQLKNRHALINPDRLLSDVSKVTGEYIKALSGLENAQPSVTDDDPLRNRIDHLLGGKIGKQPDQPFVDKVEKSGSHRYQCSIPPGFLDSHKSKDEARSVSYGGVVYDSQFGDLQIWEEMLYHCKSNAIPAVIFVTDDDKDDWWNTCDSEGRKRIGPRPELIEEIERRGGVALFHMYSSSQFLRFANKYLGSEIKSDSIRQVMETASRSEDSKSVLEIKRHKREMVIANWLAARYTGGVIQSGFPPHAFYVKTETLNIHVEVASLIDTRGIDDLIQKRIEKAFERFLNKRKEEYHLICTFSDASEEDIVNFLKGVEIRPGMTLTMGRIVSNEGGDVFFPVGESSLSFDLL